MIDFGIVQPGTTLYVPFATYDSNDPSASVTLTGLATTDIEIYKDGSVTQRASDAGYALLDTDGIDFDSTTGIHGFSVDLSDNTTAGFYAAGSQYWIVVASVTVDAATINFIAATFRIGYPSAVLNTTIATLSTQTSFTLTDGPAEADALNGMWAIVHDVASGVQTARVLISDYAVTTKTVTLAAAPTFTIAATDNISVMGMAPLQPATLGATLDTETVESDAAAIEAKASDTHSRLVVVEASIDSDQTSRTSAISDVKSRLVVVESAIDSDQTSRTAAISDVKSQLVTVASDTAAIESAGGGLSVAQDSKLTQVHSDTLSQFVVIEAKTSDTHSRLVVVESAIDSDQTSRTSAISDVKSRLVVVEAAIDSDQTSRATALANIDSQITATDSQLTVTDGVADQVYSRLQVVETAVDSDQTSRTAAISDIHSRLVVVESSIDSDQTSRTAAISDVKSALTVAASDAALLEAAHTEPTGVPAANESPLDKLGYLFMALRNKVTVTSTKKQFFDDGGTAEWEKDLTDDGTTYTETEGNAI